MFVYGCAESLFLSGLSIVAASTGSSGWASDGVDDPRLDALEELQDNVADDFDYVMAGIERLGREGMLDEAINLLNTLSDTLDSAVSIIGDDFDNGSKEDV